MIKEQEKEGARSFLLEIVTNRGSRFLTQRHISAMRGAHRNAEFLSRGEARPSALLLRRLRADSAAEFASRRSQLRVSIKSAVSRSR